VRRSRRDADVRGALSERARRRWQGRVGLLVLFALLTVGAMSSVFPFYWLLTSSLKAPLEIITFPPTLWPTEVVLTTYRDAWESLNFALYFGNTMALAAGVVVLRLAACVAAAYSLSKLNPPFAKIILFLIILVIMIPGVTYFVPQYVNVTNLPFIQVSLVNTWWAVWLPGVAAPVIIYLFKNFFDQIPADLTDAATVDGAGSLQILWRVILPMSKPVLAVAAIYSVVGVWQEFLWPLLVLPSSELWPLEVALFRVKNTGVPLNIQMAAMVIATLPMVVIFMIFQRQIMKGVVLSGNK
jgi:multiple sugar transport system permease protein